VQRVISWRHDRLPNDRTARRQYLHAMIGTSPAPGGPEMPPLWEWQAATVPRPAVFSGRPVSDLQRLLYLADRGGLREKPATTGQAGPLVARNDQGSVDRAPGSRVGCPANSCIPCGSASRLTCSNERWLFSGERGNCQWLWTEPITVQAPAVPPVRCDRVLSGVMLRPLRADKNHPP